jgi:hypothetical protein
MKAVVVGCGNIGFRHLQSIASCSEINEIYVVEPNEKRLLEVTQGELRPHFKGLIKGFLSIHDLGEALKSTDFLVSAVTADKQLNVLEDLKAIEITNLILEKPLAQSLQLLNKLKLKIKNNPIKNVYMNCPMPLWGFYKNIASPIKGPFTLEISGSNWGMGCNSIHYIDLFRTLTQSNGFSVVHSSVTKNPFTSKRGAEFEEFLGSFAIMSDKGDILHLSCSGSADARVSVAGTLKTQDEHFIFDECANKVFNVKESNIKDMGILYVSQSTGMFINSLLKEDNVDLLPTFAEAEISHKALFDVLSKSLGRDHFQIT